VVLKDEDIPTSAIGRGSDPSVGVTAGTMSKNGNGKRGGPGNKRPPKSSGAMDVDIDVDPDVDADADADAEVEGDAEIEDEIVGIAGGVMKGKRTTTMGGVGRVQVEEGDGDEDEDDHEVDLLEAVDAAEANSVASSREGGM